MKPLALLLALLCAVPAYAQISRVQTGSWHPNAGISNTFTFGSGTTIGNSVLCKIVSATAVTFGTVTDGTDTYQMVVNGPGTAHNFIYFFGFLNLSSSITTVTANYTTGPTTNMVCVEDSGVGAWGAITSPTQAVSSVTTATQTVTTQGANSFLESAFAITGGVTPTATVGTLGASGAGLADVYNTTASAGTSLSNTITWSTTQGYDAISLELTPQLAGRMQSVTTSGGCTQVGADCSINLPFNPPIGASLILFPNPVNSVTISSVSHGSDTGTVCGSVANNTTMGFLNAIYVIPNIATTGKSVKATWSSNPGSGNADLTAVVYDGLTTSPCDATGKSNNQGTTGKSLTPGSSTATNATTMLVDFCTANVTDPTPVTATSTWTQLFNTAGSSFYFIEDKYVTSASAQNPAWAATNNSAWTCNLAALDAFIPTPPPPSSGVPQVFIIHP